MSSWIELWTVAITTGVPAPERAFTQRTNPGQSLQGVDPATTSPEPPVLIDWMMDDGLPRPICSSAGTDPTKAPSRASWPMVVMMPPPDWPGMRLTWVYGVPFTNRVQETGREASGL